MAQACRHFVVGSAGSSTGFGILKSLLDAFPSASYTAVDTNPAHLVAASALPVRVARVPPADDEGYIPSILDLLRGDCTNVFVPVHDREIETVAEGMSAFPDSVVAVAPSAAVVNRCNDKWLTHEIFRQANVATPTTVLPQELAGRAADFVGWLRKPRRGVGSQGVTELRNAHDVEAAATAGDIVIQEPCLPPEITLDAFVSRRSGAYTACRERLQVKAGVCTKARLFRDAKFDELTDKLADALRLRGAFCYQVMTRCGEWAVTDVNPRLGGGTSMWLPLGVNFAAANVEDALAGSVDTWLPDVEGEHFVVRHFEEVLTV
jgi:hypothetical protein